MQDEEEEEGERGDNSSSHSQRLLEVVVSVEGEDE